MSPISAPTSPTANATNVPPTRDNSGHHSPASPLFFDHIPKTAGTTISGLLEDAYPADDVLRVYEAGHIGTRTRESLRGYRLYHGHFGRALDSVLDPGIPTVTLLRDPFEQTISHFRHALRHRWAVEMGWSDRLLPLVLNWGFAGLTYCLTSPVNRVMHNFQTRWLGVEIDFDRLSEPGGSLMEQLNVPDDDLPEALEKAKRRLDSMAVVGTVENIGGFVERVFDLIGFPAPVQIPHQNTGHGVQAGHSHRGSTWLPAAVVRRVERVTAYDQELYAYACRLAGPSHRG
jgi:hypothetical protein